MNDSQGHELKIGNKVKTDEGHSGTVTRLDGVKVEVWLPTVGITRMYYSEQLTIVEPETRETYTTRMLDEGTIDDYMSYYVSQ